MNRSSLSLGGVAPWHCAKGPAFQRGPRAMAVIAATDDGSMISLNNFHHLRLGMNYCHNINLI